MKYAVILILLALALIAWGIFCGGVVGPLLDWTGANFGLLGIAHLRRVHGVFGKRSNGSLPWWSWIVFLPLHLLNSLVWHLFRLFATESALDPASEQLSIGRRLLPWENPGGFANYVDLTAEFSEPRTFRKMPGYLAFPVLDASAPSPDHLRRAIARLRPGRTYVHCAQGHGRTGLFALAYLLSTGAAHTIEEGLVLLTKARPAIHLNSTQMACARAFADGLSARRRESLL